MRRKEEMKSWFLKWGYPKNVINREREKVKLKKPQVFSMRGVVTKGVPLVIKYHPLLKSIGTILYKHLYLLHMDKEVKKVFPVEPIVSFKSARKLSSYLVTELKLNFIHYKGQWDYLNVTKPDVKYA